MLAYDPRLISAARYSYQFGLDVVDVLASDSEDNRRIRQAALMVIGRDSEEEAARSKSKGKR